MADFTPHEAPARDLSELPVMHPGQTSGRDGILKEMYETVKTNQPVWVHGDHGMGKTTLAAALASAYAQQTRWGSLVTE